jgi:hypothetical protein
MRRLLLIPLLLLGVALPTTVAHAHRERPVACKTVNSSDFDGGLVHVRVKLTCINPSLRYDYVVKVVVVVATHADNVRKAYRISIGSGDTEVRFFRVTLLRQGTEVVSAPMHIHNLARSG